MGRREQDKENGDHRRHDGNRDPESDSAATVDRGHGRAPGKTPSLELRLKTGPFHDRAPADPTVRADAEHPEVDSSSAPEPNGPNTRDHGASATENPSSREDPRRCDSERAIVHPGTLGLPPGRTRVCAYTRSLYDARVRDSVMSLDRGPVPITV